MIKKERKEITWQITTRKYFSLLFIEDKNNLEIEKGNRQKKKEWGHTTTKG